MWKMLLVAPLMALATPAAVSAQATDFTLVNGTGKALGNLSIRRTGSNEWRPLGAAPAPDASQSVAFNDPDCAFDIRAEASSGPIVWTGVNLCEVSAVTLREAGGTPYAEYR
ncbi:hypothetical protein [Sphingomicrobium clamense]|uniref:Uncharacterized protein n=1 Tax=Sphingomicrobium clamense TaxID=2851013 RepID=A0ABS6V7K8_9SPHN|nr:hypothetical protein [Sphingomicrobium sp. B8]MBW0145531.1 hypothetical protein [Sphingomicrobium sp. B8]